MLEPTTRHLFTDALRPPTGYTVDLAIGTTYSLDLTSLLLPPLAMAAHDREADTEGGEGPADTLALLEAVRRFADRTTVFCQAGAIHVPGTYRRVLTFAEDSVVVVAPTDRGRLFHPKVWVLRFSDGTEVTHRLVCLSRNLTQDTSWDTVLQLDETERGDGIDAAPAQHFLRALPGLVVGRADPARLEQVHDVAESLAGVRFQVPDPFDSGELWPLGVGTDHAWPMPESVRQALVLSPFLDATTVGRVATRGRRVFVSQPETYAHLGGDAFEGADVRVLDPLAETDRVGQDAGTDTVMPHEVRSGLHAKTFLWDHDSSGWLFTGSANATGAAFGGNVEFSVRLHGPVRSCGVDTVLPSGSGDKDQLSLGRILQPHTIPTADPGLNPTLAMQLAIAAFHTALAGARPRLQVEETSTPGRYAVRLTWGEEPPPSPGRTTVRLVSREAGHHAQPIGASPLWTDLRMLDLTPFVAVETTTTSGDPPEPVTIACVLKAELVGAPPDRGSEVLRSFLTSEESIVRYLAFLLGDGGDGFGGDADSIADRGGMGAGPPRPTFDNLALLETLLRAAARGDASLGRVEALLTDLRSGETDDVVISQEFRDVWSAVWAVAGGKDSA